MNVKARVLSQFITVSTGIVHDGSGEGPKTLYSNGPHHGDVQRIFPLILASYEEK